MESQEEIFHSDHKILTSVLIHTLMIEGFLKKIVKDLLVMLQTHQVMQLIVREAKIAAMSVVQDVLLRKDQEDLQVCLVHLDLRVYKVTLVWKVYLVLKVTKEILVSKDQEAQKETEVKWECLGFLV